MRIAIVQKKGLPLANITKEIRSAGFTLTKNKPNIVLSLGGDGTFLESERTYPGVPKVMIRESWICKKCEDATLEEVLHGLKNKEYRIEELPKLRIETTIKGKKVRLTAVNDISIRNKLMNRALRFSVNINGKEVQESIIGDGVVLATPFGSTGYYQSISRQTIANGFGMAFNNATVPIPPITVSPNSRVDIIILRHEANIAVDNDPRILTVKPGTKITISQDKSIARLIRLR